MKWLEVASEPDDIPGALARLGLAPRAPPKPPSRALFGQALAAVRDPLLTGCTPPAQARVRLRSANSRWVRTFALSPSLTRSSEASKHSPDPPIARPFLAFPPRFSRFIFLWRLNS
jgi:hypothetical protein